MRGRPKKAQWDGHHHPEILSSSSSITKDAGHPAASKKPPVKRHTSEHVTHFGQQNRKPFFMFLIFLEISLYIWSILFRSCLQVD
jgi:hypothetical protein